MSAYSLFNELSRFACENKLTLSVFVNMSFKYNKLFIQYIIYFLKYAFSGPWRTWRCCPVIFRKNSSNLCQKEAHVAEQHKIFYISPKCIGSIWEFSSSCICYKPRIAQSYDQRTLSYMPEEIIHLLPYWRKDPMSPFPPSYHCTQDCILIHATVSGNAGIAS